ncbi:MAG TPA: sensor domain-containing protein, partial [Thermomicrobiales bacterium]|nr:sensor domain-containing protein [Thermomicrobiales bacterium]
MAVRPMTEVDTSRRSSLRNPLKLWISAEPWLALLFMLSSFVLGLFWFVVLVVLLSVGGSMAFTLVGIPVLIAGFFLWTLAARFERMRVGALLGVRIRDPYNPLPEGTLWQRWKTRLSDPHRWLDLLYLFLLFPLGIIQFVIAVVFTALPLNLVTTPAWYWIADGPVMGPTDDFRVDTLPEALLVAVIGLPFLLALPYILVGVGRGHAWLARHLLGTDREAELTARVDQLTVSRSRAMDSSLDDLRRIERDLHDGAQQRLVKLSMDLGMAKEKMETDPEAARALVSEAHEESKRAMAEIRDLARGIHPA